MSNLIILNGYGIKINVSDGNLFIKNGTPLTADDKNECYRLRPGQKKITEILIYGQSGYISLEAFKWISLQNIQLNIFNWDGGLLSSVNQEKDGSGKRKIAQYQSYIDTKKKLYFAKKIIEVQISDSINFLNFSPIFRILIFHILIIIVAM